MVNYAEPEEIPSEPATRMLEIVQSNSRMKPWTLVSRTTDEFDSYSHEEMRLQVLKPLVLSGVLSTTADGNIKSYKPEKLNELI